MYIFEIEYVERDKFECYSFDAVVIARSEQRAREMVVGQNKAGTVTIKMVGSALPTETERLVVFDEDHKVYDW